MDLVELNSSLSSVTDRVRNQSVQHPKLHHCEKAGSHLLFGYLGSLHSFQIRIINIKKEVPGLANATHLSNHRTFHQSLLVTFFLKKKKYTCCDTLLHFIISSIFITIVTNQINCVFLLPFQLDGDIIALRTVLNSTEATLQSSISSLKSEISLVNQTLNNLVSQVDSVSPYSN